jgi:hypothetical protein
VLAVACLSKLEGVPSLGQDAGASEPTCGVRGRRCCEPPDERCQASLVCDEESSLCERAPTRYCASDAECPVEQICCISGLLGRCAATTHDSCPTLDLTVSTPEIAQTDPIVARPTEDSELERCLVQRGCLRPTSSTDRQLLSFTLSVSNVGEADLVLGAAGMTPGITSGCDGRWAIERFLRYQLIDAKGDAVVESYMSSICEASPSSVFSAPFNCDFMGMWSGYSQRYTPIGLVPEMGPDGAEVYAAHQCQWLDITGVPPGDYSLRVTVNPDGLFNELDQSNNRADDLQVVIPNFDDITQPCGDPANPLFGAGVYQECAWSPSEEQVETGTTSCVADESIELVCYGCGKVRICDGEGPCRSASSIYSTESCSFISGFSCPVSATFSIWLATDDETDPIRCSAVPGTLTSGIP